MFFIYILFFSSQICSSWQDESQDLSQKDLSNLDNEIHMKIPWLWILALTQRENLLTGKKTPISGKLRPLVQLMPLASKQPRPPVMEARVTEIQHFPWHAQVIVTKKVFTAVCGGVVASKRIVITTGHCVHDDARGAVISPHRVRVLLGSSYLFKGNKYKVCKISVHPGYLDVPFSYYYDLALILLRKKIHFNINVQPAKIIQNDHWRDTKYSFNVVGFGAASLKGNEESKLKKSGSKKLHKTRMRFVDSLTCNQAPNLLGKGKMPVPPHMFCMIGVRQSDCYGDTGSGVSWRDHVVGIVAVSRGKKCGSTNIPSMYNDLNAFGEWIRYESPNLESYKSHCDGPGKESLIYNGTQSNIKKFPWIAQIIITKSDFEVVCGGFVASSRVIVTAAHCVVDTRSKEPLDPEQIQVFLGSSFRNEGEKYKVCQIKKHPLFQQERFYYYDIALISVHQKIKFSDRVRRAKVIRHHKWKAGNNVFTVAGFGATSNDEEDDTNSIEAPAVLREAEMRFVDAEECNASPSGFGKGKMPVPDHMFCMVGEDTGDCYGDSGSGIMWNNEYVIGLVVIGRVEKCSSNVPSMYVDVLYFRPWLEECIEMLHSKKDECDPTIKEKIL